MKPILKVYNCILLTGVVILISCTKEKSCEGCRERNQPPIANAGPDQTITLPTNFTVLNGSSSIDPDNNITHYTWTKIAGPASFNIANISTVQTGVTGLEEGIYQFELKVTDAGNLSSRDTIAVTVEGEADVVNVQWTELRHLPDEFSLGNNTPNLLIGIQDKVFALSNNLGFWQYDVPSNTWIKKGNFPEYARDFSVVFSVGNKGYFIANSICWEYDTVTEQWTKKSNPPSYTSGPNHVYQAVPLVINNKAYLIGSINNRITAYDPSTDSYTQKNNFPGASAKAGFVINGEGYGIDTNGRCWKYDPITDSWQQKATLPVSYSMSGFSLNGYGYIIASQPNYVTSLWRYDPSINQWKQVEKNYPGDGSYEVKTVSLHGIVYVGLGSGDFEMTDFWSFQ